MLAVDSGSLPRLGVNGYMLVERVLKRVKKELMQQFQIPAEINLRVGGALLRKLVADRKNDTENDTDILHKTGADDRKDRNPYDSHIDMANQMSYDYSTVLLLNEVGEDASDKTFRDAHAVESSDGSYINENEFSQSRGEFIFVDELEDIVVESKPGRLIMFSSGSENLHRVAPFNEGVRYSLAAWWEEMFDSDIMNLTTPIVHILKLKFT